MSVAVDTHEAPTELNQSLGSISCRDLRKPVAAHTPSCTQVVEASCVKVAKSKIHSEQWDVTWSSRFVSEPSASPVAARQWGRDEFASAARSHSRASHDEYANGPAWRRRIFRAGHRLQSACNTRLAFDEVGQDMNGLHAVGLLHAMRVDARGSEGACFPPYKRCWCTGNPHTGSAERRCLASRLGRATGQGILRSVFGLPSKAPRGINVPPRRRPPPCQSRNRSRGGAEELRMDA